MNPERATLIDDSKHWQQTRHLIPPVVRFVVGLLYLSGMTDTQTHVCGIIGIIGITPTDGAGLQPDTKANLSVICCTTWIDPVCVCVL